MDKIFKIGSLSLEWHKGLLALNITPIFFKNNVMKKKNKNTLNKKHLNTCHCISRDSREANI